MSDIKELSFEAAYAELEQIISQLDEGNLPLAESVRLFERGRKLAEHCQGLLDGAELRINQIADNGSLEPL